MAVSKIEESETPQPWPSLLWGWIVGFFNFVFHAYLLLAFGIICKVLLGL